MLSASFNSSRKVSGKEQNELFTLAPFLCLKNPTTDPQKPSLIPVPSLQIRNQALPESSQKNLFPFLQLSQSPLRTHFSLYFSQTQVAKTVFQMTSRKGFILDHEYFLSVSYWSSRTVLAFFMSTLHAYFQINLWPTGIYMSHFPQLFPIAEIPAYSLY